MKDNELYIYIYKLICRFKNKIVHQPLLYNKLHKCVCAKHKDISVNDLILFNYINSVSLYENIDKISFYEKIYNTQTTNNNCKFMCYEWDSTYTKYQSISHFLKEFSSNIKLDIKYIFIELGVFENGDCGHSLAVIVNITKMRDSSLHFQFMVYDCFGNYQQNTKTIIAHHFIKTLSSNLKKTLNGTFIIKNIGSYEGLQYVANDSLFCISFNVFMITILIHIIHSFSQLELTYKTINQIEKYFHLIFQNLKINYKNFIQKFTMYICTLYNKNIKKDCNFQKYIITNFKYSIFNMLNILDVDIKNIIHHLSSVQLNKICTHFHLNIKKSKNKKKIYIMKHIDKKLLQWYITKFIILDNKIYKTINNKLNCT